MDRDGQVKSSDFGLALARQGDPSTPAGTRVTDPEMVLGTPTFMAPEQIDDPRQADGRSDIYSLGCTLYWLLTGRAMFAEESLGDVLTTHRDAPIVPLGKARRDVPKSLDTVEVRGGEVFHRHSRPRSTSSQILGPVVGKR